MGALNISYFPRDFCYTCVPSLSYELRIRLSSDRKYHNGIFIEMRFNL